MKNIKSKVLVLTLVLLTVVMSFSVAFADDIIDSKKGSVVRIAYEYEGEKYSAGTGFAIGEEGKAISYIVTNFHVVCYADYPDIVKYYLYRGEDDYIEIKPVFTLEDNDVALMKLTQPIYNIDPLVLNTGEQAKVTDRIFCLGFPESSGVLDDAYGGKPEDVVVTSGIISKISASNGIEFYQIDSGIDSGNSGGPLINEDGIVIGINTCSIENVIYGITVSDTGINGSIMLDELIGALDSRGIKYEHTDGATLEEISASNVTDEVEATAQPSDNNDVDDETGLSKNTILIAGIVLLAIILVFVIALILIRRKSSNAAIPTQMNPVPVPKKASSSAMVIGVTGNYAGNIHKIKGKIYFGRSSKCHVKYPSDYKGISNQHCSLSSKGKEFTLIDTGSSYGTFLENGQKLQPNVPYILKSGDKFYLADKKELFQVAIND